MVANKNINWKYVKEQIELLLPRIEKQNFQIDLTYDIATKLKENCPRRYDLNMPTVGAYWGKQITEHYILNNFKLDKQGYLIEVEYYSYLNILNLLEFSLKKGVAPYIVDLITDSTDYMGMDLDEWMSDNDFFQENMKDIWVNSVLDMWMKEGKLAYKKNVSNFEHYWKNEDYILQMTVFDFKLRPVLLILCATYNDF